MCTAYRAAFHVEESTMKDTRIDPVFRSIDDKGRGKISCEAIVRCLARSGISLDDPRLAALKASIEARGNASVSSDEFETHITNHSYLVTRAAKNDLVIPQFDQFTRDIEKIFATTKQISDGEVADYIPYLARVPADKFAVAITTIDGQQLSLGDSADAFTLQSSCKPMLYCAALEEHGERKVHSHVGREPSGFSFNELTLNKSGLPHNPMINAGAIMTSSLIRREDSTADRMEYLTGLISAMSGQQHCHFNSAVWHSERETADRNFALAHLMREQGAFPEGIEIQETLDYFFSACSIEINASAMATVGATLANGGVCPQTGERVFAAETVKNCLSMMNSCGMYNYSGEFAFTVGIPAKSSVSGVVLAVIPNVMGIVVWSPRLDACGNSVRGVEFLKELVARFNFHNYDSMVESKKKDPRRLVHAQQTDHLYRAIYAASIGDVSELRRLVAYGHDLNAADYDGRTPLHLACAEGQVEAVKYLLQQDVCSTPKDRWGNTPLTDAKRHEQTAVQALFNPGQQNQHSRTDKHVRVA